MKKIPRLFIITGPTCTGKTAAVNALLESNKKTHVICFDSCQIYQDFAIGTGRADALFSERSHLYGYRDSRKALSVSEYIEDLLAKYHEIINQGGLPFLEGGSRSYMKALCELEKEGKISLVIVGLKPPSDTYINTCFVRRTEGFVEEGILEEIEQNINKEMGESFLMRNYEVYQPFVQYLQKKLSLEEAKQLVIQRMKEMHEDQYNTFRRMLNISWLTVTEPNCLDILTAIFDEHVSELYQIA